MAKIVIIGAHGALGGALYEALADRGVDAEIVRATTTEHLGPSLDLLDVGTFDGADLAFAASSDDFSRTLARGASRLGVPLVDLAGVLPSSAPLVAPLFGGNPASKLLEAGAVRVPLGLVPAVAAVLRALSPFGPRAIRVVTFEGAAGADEAGMEALSAEARAVFTQRETGPSIFYAPLAFSVLSSVWEEHDPFGPDEVFAHDLRACLSSFGGAPQDPGWSIRVVRTRVSLFTAEAASIEVELSDPPALEVLVETLAGARGLRESRTPAPSALEAVDRDDAIFGRVRLQAPLVDLFVAADRLRFGAAFQGALLAESFLEQASKG